MAYVSSMGAEPAPQDCQMACYEAKSKAYAACQKLPLDKRKEKVACFERADAQLKGCLGKCSAPSGALIALMAGVGLLVIEAVT